MRNVRVKTTDLCRAIFGKTIAVKSNKSNDSNTEFVQPCISSQYYVVLREIGYCYFIEFKWKEWNGCLIRLE